MAMSSGECSTWWVKPVRGVYSRACGTDTRVFDPM